MRRPERPKPSKLAVSNHPSGKRQRLRCEPWLGSCKREHDDQRHHSEARHLAIIFAPAPDVKLTARGGGGNTPRKRPLAAHGSGATCESGLSSYPSRCEPSTPMEQFDEIARDGISRPGRCAAVLRAPSGEPAARRSRYARVTGVVRLPRSRSPVEPVGGPHFLGRYDCAHEGQSVWDSRLAVETVNGGFVVRGFESLPLRSYRRFACPRAAAYRRCR
jgi:hypothetical protein